MKSRFLLASALLLLASGAIGAGLVLLPQDESDKTLVAPTPTLAPPLTPTPMRFPTRPMPPAIPTPDPLRDVPEVTLIDTLTGARQPLWTPGYRVHEVVFYNQWVYYGRFQWPPGNAIGEIMAMDLTTLQAQKIADGSGIAISVNGDIAYTTRGADGSRQGAILDRFGRPGPQPGGVGRFEWSPDGRWLTSWGEISGDRQPIPQFILDYRSGAVRQFAETLPCNCDGGPGVIWAPDSARFEFTRLVGTPGQTSPVGELYEPWGLTRVAAPRVSAWLDATRYVVLPQRDQEQHFIYNVVTGQRSPMPARTHPSPDGRLFATSDGPASDAFDVLDGSGAIVLAHLPGRFEAWSSDGRYILASSGEFGLRRSVHVYDITGRLLYSRERAGGSISPDASKLAVVDTRYVDPATPYSQQTSDVWLVDLTTGLETKIASDLRGGLGCTEWSADSRFVAVTFCPGV